MFNKPILILIAGFLFLLFPSTANAQVVINEFSSNSNPEWVELYNPSGSPIDLTGWTISDKVQAPKSLSGSIPASGYFVYENLEGWLNNSGGDIITLRDNLNNVQNSISYGNELDSVVAIPASDKSAGRVPNGSNSWQNNLIWTKESQNPDPTPIPTPSPTPSPTPTKTPTPTPTPTKTPTPTPTKTPTPKPSPKDKVVVESQTPDNSQILGLREQLKTSEPKEEGGEGSKKKFPILPILLIVGGVGCMGAAGYVVFKNMQKEAPNNYNNGSEENT